MNRKNILDDYFTFTKKDRLALLIITGLLCFVFFSPQFLKKKFSPTSPKNDTAWISSLKKLEIKQSGGYKDSLNNNDDDIIAYQYDRSKNSYNNPVKSELFYFDPNTASIDDWEKLGLKNKTIQIIQKYIAKGGYFKQAEDLKRIYSLHTDEYERLAPFIRIKEKSKPFETINYPETKYASNKHSYTVIDINTADTSAFIALPGIGSKLAARIVTFREKLGGFYSVGQIGETYGLPDSTFQKIKPYLKFENANIKKININTGTIDELKAHPYIKYSIANPIIAYRNQHGPFSKIEDIKKVMVVTDEVYEKIAPYLTIK